MGNSKLLDEIIDLGNGLYKFKVFRNSGEEKIPIILLNDRNEI